MKVTPLESAETTYGSDVLGRPIIIKAAYQLEPHTGEHIGPVMVHFCLMKDGTKFVIFEAQDRVPLSLFLKNNWLIKRSWKFFAYQVAELLGTSKEELYQFIEDYRPNA